MIKGLHGLFYTPQPDELRAFIRDKLQLPYTDTGGGWLIFDLPGGDLGAHPSDRAYHAISFFCDDIFSTVETLKARGVEFTSGISEQDWGWLTTFRMPGDIEVELYEPKYAKKTQKSMKGTRKVTKKRNTRKQREKPQRRKRENDRRN